MRWLYSLLMVCVQPLLLRKLRRRGRAEPGYLEAVPERFGRYSVASDADGDIDSCSDRDAGRRPGRVWIHAVSLGETRAAAILIEALRRRQPELRLLLTHGTATGRAEGVRLLRGGDLQAWLPWDTPQAVQRFLDHFSPRLGVLMETEVWPNLAAACRARGVPLALANARLSARSLAQAQRLAWLSRPAYASLAGVWPQTDADARRLACAGAAVTGIHGNLKFDATPDAAQLAQGRRWREAAAHPVVMFASSREGEEADFFRVLKESRDLAQAGWARRTADAMAPAIRWLVVPRHPQRFDAVALLAAEAGFSVSRRSGWDSAPSAADIWIGDSLGDMALYYGLADVALLGGSFAPLGGQNLIEAAACGCPVVMGPHTFNFADAAELALAAGAAQRATTIDAAVRLALELLGDPARRQAAAAAAATFAAAHRGAADKTAQAVLGLAAR